MNLDRRTIMRDAGWIRQIVGLSVGMLGLLLCLVILFARSDGNFTGWSAVKAAGFCLFAWWLLTKIGSFIGEWLSQLMVGVAEIKRQQEIKESMERAKAMAAERAEARDENTITRVGIDLLRPGMRLGRKVLAPDGSEVFPPGKELMAEDILRIRELKTPFVYVMVTPEG